MLLAPHTRQQSGAVIHSLHLLHFSSCVCVFSSCMSCRSFNLLSRCDIGMLTTAGLCRFRGFLLVMRMPTEEKARIVLQERSSGQFIHRTSWSLKGLLLHSCLVTFDRQVSKYASRWKLHRNWEFALGPTWQWINGKGQEAEVLWCAHVRTWRTNSKRKKFCK